MKDWKDIPARRDATWEFCVYLQNNPNEFPKTSEDAKRLFAKCGQFYVEGDPPKPGDEKLTPIPKKTEFRVYPFNPITGRDTDLVTIVLPEWASQAGQAIPPRNGFDPVEVWRCTWANYLEHRVELLG
jgi:hypothetical protein